MWLIQNSVKILDKHRKFSKSELQSVLDKTEVDENVATKPIFVLMQIATKAVFNTNAAAEQSKQNLLQLCCTTYCVIKD